MKVTSWIARSVMAVLTIAILAIAGHISIQNSSASVIADGGGPIKTTGG
jgi:hypothetical protein